MSNIVPLIIGGGFLAFLLTNKKKNTSSVSSKFGSKEIGYEIINCNKVIIYDKEKAYQYMFELGKKEGSTIHEDGHSFSPGDIVLGLEKCLSIEQMKKDSKVKSDEEMMKIVMPKLKKIYSSQEIAEFIFNLHKYLMSGYAIGRESEEVEEVALDFLEQNKNLIESLGYSVENLNIEVIGK